MITIEQSYPLVTIAILSYNQEDYIEDAIQGALLQDYPNLEIIVSDDSSVDSTFDKASKFISKYDGDHIIRLNKTVSNKCTLAHFFEIIDLASGEFLILAAGDDISKPERVSKIVDIWKKNNATAIFSNYQLIDQYGFKKTDIYSPNQESELFKSVFRKAGLIDIHGASSAYDMSFLKKITKPVGRFFFEDTYMTFMLGMYDKIIFKIDDPLVYYRSHSESISNSNNSFSSLKEIRSAQKKASYYAKNKYELYILMRNIYYIESSLNKDLLVDASELDRYMNKFMIQSIWIDLSLISMSKYVLKYRNDKIFLKWILPRVLGLKSFSLLKFIKDTNNRIRF